jgi:hypothetical protein
MANDDRRVQTARVEKRRDIAREVRGCVACVRLARGAMATLRHREDSKRRGQMREQSLERSQGIRIPMQQQHGCAGRIAVLDVVEPWSAWQVHVLRDDSIVLMCLQRPACLAEAERRRRDVR